MKLTNNTIPQSKNYFIGVWFKMITKDSYKFMVAVYRNWGYYSETAHKQAEKIKEDLLMMKGGNKKIMGQRFQSVFILPSINMGEVNLKPNPNNREEEVLVFHNQWLYGKGALNINLQIMERLKEAIKNKSDCGRYANTKQDYKNHFLERDLINAINWASVQELHRETKFTDYDSGFIYGSKNEMKLSKCLKNQDNNNGFFICEIQSDLNIKYCFISGLEDTEQHEYKTPKEYLELFYSRNDLIKEGSLKDMKELLNRFKEFKRTPKEDFKIVLKEMNQ